MKQGIFARTMAAESTEQVIDIIGVIGWEVGYQTLREILRAIPENVKAVTFEIYSPGGDVWEGNGIVQEIGELSKRGVKTMARVQVAASMATLIAVACDERTIAANGRFLIHNAWAGVTGDAAEMEKMAKTLRDCEQEAAKFYADRTGAKSEDILKLMAEERWMLPEETLAFGFVQKICDPFKPEEYAAIKQEIVASGKWPKALIEMPVTVSTPEGNQNASNTDKNTIAISTVSASQPDSASNDAGYIRGLAEGEKIRASENEKYTVQLSKQKKLISDHQSAKDKAEGRIKALESDLVKVANDAKAKLDAVVADLTVKHTAELDKLKVDNQAALAALDKKLSDKISELTNLLKEANDRNSKLITGSLTFEPSVTTWEEALAACGGDHVKACQRYPEIQKALIESANQKRKKK